MLDIGELLELEEEVRDHLDEHLDQILIKLNRTDELQDFLDLIGMSSDCLITPEMRIAKDGKILVIGQSDIDLNKLTSVAKSLGIDKDRLEFHLDYEDGKNFNFEKTKWSPNYSAILVGPMPHSGESKGENGSVIATLETEEGYPPVRRMGANGLKITKSSFKSALEQLMQEKIVA